MVRNSIPHGKGNTDRVVWEEATEKQMWTLWEGSQKKLEKSVQRGQS